MSCSIVFIGVAGDRTKNSAWSAEEHGDTTRVAYQGGVVKIKIPFSVFDRYTNHCSSIGISADFSPENIPSVLQEFGQQPSRRIRPSDNPAIG